MRAFIKIKMRLPYSVKPIVGCNSEIFRILRMSFELDYPDFGH